MHVDVNVYEWSVDRGVHKPIRNCAFENTPFNRIFLALSNIRQIELHSQSCIMCPFICRRLYPMKLNRQSVPQTTHLNTPAHDLYCFRLYYKHPYFSLPLGKSDFLALFTGEYGNIVVRRFQNAVERVLFKQKLLLSRSLWLFSFHYLMLMHSRHCGQKFLACLTPYLSLPQISIKVLQFFSLFFIFNKFLILC